MQTANATCILTAPKSFRFSTIVFLRLVVYIAICLWCMFVQKIWFEWIFVAASRICSLFPSPPKKKHFDSILEHATNIICAHVWSMWASSINCNNKQLPVYILCVCASQRDRKRRRLKEEMNTIEKRNAKSSDGRFWGYRAKYWIKTIYRGKKWNFIGDINVCGTDT